MSSQLGGDRTVLLVDPIGTLQSHLGEKLTAAGFDVASVETGAECLSHLERDENGGVVSVCELPDMDGPTLLRTIRISNPLLPVLLFCPTQDSMEGAVSSEMSGAIQGDADPETVVSELEGLMNGGVEGLQRYRHLIEMSPAPINIFDEDGNSIWCNDAVLELFGLDSREEFLGRSILEMIHPDDRETAQAEIAAVIDEKRDTGPTRMKLRRDDGEVRHVRVSTTIGEFMGADIGQAIAIDETERIEREKQLRVLDNWLRHNIRNKMTIISGLAADIQAGRVDDVAASAQTIQESADALVNQADHERQIIQILEGSRDQSHVAVDVGDLVTGVVDDAREDYPEAAISVGSIEPFTADAIAELDVAIAELVENAVTHNDTESPTVTVEVVDSEADYGVIRITDNGTGIPEAEQNNLHLDKEVDQLKHGSGLGLVLVYWIVRLSGGNIEVTPNDPRGSVVTVRLPKA